MQKLGVQLLQNLETTQEQPNIIISPVSISLALSQLALGTHVQLLHDTACFLHVTVFGELCQQLAVIYSTMETVTVVIQLLHLSSLQVQQMRQRSY